MPDFRIVFSTTTKVLLSLIVIFCIVALAIGILGGMAMLSHPRAVAAAPTDTNDAGADLADALRTSMPKSAWDRGLARAVRHHCYAAGMNHEEVLQALGEPSEKKDWGAHGSAWTWQLAPGACLKYDGENCVERKKHERIVFFTAKGNVFLDATGECESLNGDYISTSDLFGKSDWK